MTIDAYQGEGAGNAKPRHLRAVGDVHSLAPEHLPIQTIHRGENASPATPTHQAVPKRPDNAYSINGNCPEWQAGAFCPHDGAPEAPFLYIAGGVAALACGECIASGAALDYELACDSRFGVWGCRAS